MGFTLYPLGNSHGKHGHQSLTGDAYMEVLFPVAVFVDPVPVILGVFSSSYSLFGIDPVSQFGSLLLTIQLTTISSRLHLNDYHD